MRGDSCGYTLIIDILENWEWLCSAGGAVETIEYFHSDKFAKEFEKIAKIQAGEEWEKICEKKWKHDGQRGWFEILCICAAVPAVNQSLIPNRKKVLHDLDMGSDMYKNHLDKLKNLGYVSTERIRGADGRIGGVKFIINYNKLLSLKNEFAIGE